MRTTTRQPTNDVVLETILVAQCKNNDLPRACAIDIVTKQPKTKDEYKSLAPYYELPKSKFKSIYL